MTEYQIMNSFNMFMISNAMFQLGVFLLFWITFRWVRAIYTIVVELIEKILCSVFGLGVVFNGLMVSGFFYANWEGTSYALSQLESLSPTAQSFVDYLPVDTLPEVSLIPWNPVMIVWWLAVIVAILYPVWMKKRPKFGLDKSGSVKC